MRPKTGVLVAHGDRACGYSLYMIDGHLVHDYNAAGDHTIVRSTQPVTAGVHTLSYQFSRTGPHQGMGQLLVDDEAVGEAAIEATLPLILSFEGLDIGADEMVAVSAEYESPFSFSGRLTEVRYDLADDQGAEAETARQQSEIRKQ